MANARVVRLHPDDDIVVALDQLVSGTVVQGIAVAGQVPPGRKMATGAIEAGAHLRRHGQVIGAATRAIPPGQHVHTHNLSIAKVGRDDAQAVDARPTKYVDTAATFGGTVRADDGTASIDELGEHFFRLIPRTASGERSRSSELHGYGQQEFVPWQSNVIT